MTYLEIFVIFDAGVIAGMMIMCLVTIKGGCYEGCLMRGKS